MEGIPENFTQAQLLPPLLSMHLGQLLSVRELVSRSLSLLGCKTGQYGRLPPPGPMESAPHWVKHQQSTCHEHHYFEIVTLKILNSARK